MIEHNKLIKVAWFNYYKKTFQNWNGLLWYVFNCIISIMLLLSF